MCRTLPPALAAVLAMCLAGCSTFTRHHRSQAAAFDSLAAFGTVTLLVTVATSGCAENQDIPLECMNTRAATVGSLFLLGAAVGGIWILAAEH